MSSRADAIVEMIEGIKGMDSPMAAALSASVAVIASDAFNEGVSVVSKSLLIATLFGTDPVKPENPFTHLVDNAAMEQALQKNEAQG